MNNILAFLAGGFGMLLMLGVGLAQIVIGYIGIEYHLGAGWAIGAVVLAFVFRFSLPLTVGTFFGAMDGASKFVRGDAVAGLLITLINVLGGIIIGVAQQDLTFKQASQTYTLLFGSE